MTQQNEMTDDEGHARSAKRAGAAQPEDAPIYYAAANPD